LARSYARQKDERRILFAQASDWLTSGGTIPADSFGVALEGILTGNVTAFPRPGGLDVAPDRLCSDVLRTKGEAGARSKARVDGPDASKPELPASAQHPEHPVG
jgi:hypothetical protein